MRKLAIFSLFLPVLSGCSDSPEVTELTGNCPGVSVFVNFAGKGEDISKCVRLTNEAELTANVFSAAGITTEGTVTYGDQIVCRVNGIPSATEPLEVEGNAPHLESCQDMPPAFAYWALWVKPAGSSEWEYATEGVSSLEVSPGDSVGLAFSLAGQTPTPEGE